MIHGLMKYPVAESTGVAHEGIDDIIAGNRADYEASLPKPKLEATIGPDPAYDEEGNLRIDMGWAPDISTVPFMTKKSLLKYATGLKRNLKNMALRRDVSGQSWDVGTKLKNIPKNTKRAVRSYLNTSRPYQQLRKSFRKWDQPALAADDPIMLSADKAKLHTIEDIGGKKGLDRLFHTIGATDSPMNNPRVRAAIRDQIESRILHTEIKNLPRSYNPIEVVKKLWGKGQPIGGRAFTQGTPRATVEYAKSKPSYLETVGKHEFTHIGQMQGPRDAKWLEHMGKKHKLTGDEMTWLQNNVYSRARSGVGDPRLNPNRLPTQRWEDQYMDKIYPHLQPKAKAFYDKFQASKTPYWKLKGKDLTNEYYIRAREIAARGSQIRHEIDKMIAGDKTQKKAGSLLERLASRERRVLTDEGIDMIVNKLWGAAPVGLGLSFQEGEAKK